MQKPDENQSEEVENDEINDEAAKNSLLTKRSFLEAFQGGVGIRSFQEMPQHEDQGVDFMTRYSPKKILMADFNKHQANIEEDKLETD